MGRYDPTKHLEGVSKEDPARLEARIVNEMKASIMSLDKIPPKVLEALERDPPPYVEVEMLLYSISGYNGELLRCLYQWKRIVAKRLMRSPRGSLRTVSVPGRK